MEDMITFRVDAFVKGLQYSIQEVLDTKHKDITKIIEAKLNEMRKSGELQKTLDKAVEDGITRYAEQSVRDACQKTFSAYGSAGKEFSKMVETQLLESLKSTFKVNQ